ncbi:MAG TPA: RHS repeat-associated core domain-containing protein [Clostridia bacterium]|nr:RHS repeat-associated core domain-containing protein [Clostridia bacterium]
MYLLTLEVWGGEVQGPTTEVRFALNTDLHLGRLTFSQEDLAVSAGGIPVRIVRSYDSSLGVGTDLGGGWRLALSDLQPELDEERTDTYLVDDYGRFPCSVRTGGGRNVTLTLPDGRCVTYRFGLRVGASGYAYAEFTPPPGVFAKLRVQGDNRLVYALSAWTGGSMQPYWQDGGQQTEMESFDFPGYILTLEDGTELFLNRDIDPEVPDGGYLPNGAFVRPRGGRLYVSEIRRPNGEKTVFTQNAFGIDQIQTMDSAGQTRPAVVFKRTNGLITSIIDGRTTEAVPAVKYEYTGGKLTKVHLLVDPARTPQPYDTITYHYDDTRFPYYVTSIEDPRNANVTTVTEYYPDGDPNRGKLHHIRKQPGNITTTFEYDLTTMTQTVTDAVGVQTRHTFNLAGQITQTEVHNSIPWGELISRTINEFDPNTRLLTSQTVFIGSEYATTSYEYDDRGNVTKVTDPNGLSTSFTHNSFGQVVSTTDPREKTAVNDYDIEGNLLSATDAGGGVTSNTYENGRLKTSTSPVGAVTTYTYYAGETGGNPGDLKTVTITESDRTTVLGRTSYTYDANGNIATERQEHRTSGAEWAPVQARVTTYAYDLQNRVINTLVQADPPDPQVNASSSITYNAIGKQDTTTDNLGRVTKYYYDSYGNLVQTEYPASAAYPAVNISVARTVYDAAGRATYIQDRVEASANAASTTGPGRHQVYDGLGRVVRTEQLESLTINLSVSGSIYSTTLPSQTPRVLAATETRYDIGGRVYQTAERRLDPSGDPALETDRTQTTHEYDAAGRRLKTWVMVDDQDGNFVESRLVGEYSYDPSGNVLTFTDASSEKTEYEYDAMNRRVLTRFPLASGESVRTTRLTRYNEAGLRVAEIDDLNRSTSFGYDSLGRLIRVTDPDGRMTDYKYDWFGNLVEQTDALRRTTTFRYDVLSRRTRRELPGTQFETFTYDAAGNRLTHSDFNGKTTVFTYDVLNRLRKITPDASLVGETPVQFDYFASGQRKRMIDASGTTDLLYDPLGRLQSKAAPAGKITYLYNDTAPRRTLTVSTANQNGTARTGLGATTVVYRWNSLNQLASATDTGLATTQYGFDVRGNLESVLYPAGANGLETHYTYDSRNRLRGMTVGSAAMAHYLYDVLPDGKRNRATESGSAINATGDRTVDYAYDNINRLTKESIAGDEGGKNGDLAYTLDNVGNRTWYKAVPFGTFGSSATFDENDRLNPASNFDKNGNTLVSGGATFQYDFQNRLKARTSGTAVQLVYDGDGNLVSRTVGGVTTWYLVEDRNPTGYPQVLEEVAADRSQVMKRYTWGLALISQEDSAISYSGLDGHGNVRFLLDSAGNARADRYVYDAYGRLIRSAGTTPNVYRYCGERLDPDLGLYYLRARYYNPQTGRFWTMDSYEGSQSDPLSLHKYLYAQDNPINLTDPSGHNPLSAAINGQLVHKIIGRDFMAKVPGGISGPAVSTVLGGLYPGTYFPTILMFPDLIDVQGKQIYEIKPFPRWLDGKLQLTMYVGAFNFFDPAKGWTAGSTYMPPSKIYLGALAWAIVYQPSGGVIMYDVIDVPALVMVSAGAVATIRNADIIATTCIATLNSLMGAL